MPTLKFVDAISSASISGGPFDGVAFYIGGDAFRVWSPPEIEARPERFRLPIWVRDNPHQVDPAADAARCLVALARFGVPIGSLVALDSEMAVDPGWTHTFVSILNGASVIKGYPVIDYGSESTLRGNMNPDGYYWGADWTSVPHLHTGEGMTQYLSLQNEDVSLANAALPLWDTHRSLQALKMVSVPMVLPVLQQGMYDVAGRVFYVHKLQHILNQVINDVGLKLAPLTTDGVFGAKTTEAVKEVQNHFGLTRDGIVGPMTWEAIYSE